MSPEHEKSAERGVRLLEEAKAICSIIDSAMHNDSSIDRDALRYAISGVSTLVERAGDVAGFLADEIRSEREAGPR